MTYLHIMAPKSNKPSKTFAPFHHHQLDCGAPELCMRWRIFAPGHRTQMAMGYVDGNMARGGHDHQHWSPVADG